MRDDLILILALALSFCGMGWLALSMTVHWQQVRSATEPSRRAVMTLRTLGILALLLSLWLHLEVDHVSMASLVWIMSLAAMALVVAFTLTWRPRWLACLLWGRRRKPRP